MPRVTKIINLRAMWRSDSSWRVLYQSRRVIPRTVRGAQRPPQSAAYAHFPGCFASSIDSRSILSLILTSARPGKFPWTITTVIRTLAYKPYSSQIRRTCGPPIAQGSLSGHLQQLRKCSKITRALAIGPIIKAALVHHASSFQVGRPLVSNMDSSSTTTQQRNAASHLNAGIRHYRNDWKSLV
jgi:hypothetical protein